MFLLLLCYVVVLCHASIEPNNRVPSFIRVCSRNDPELNQCVKSSVDALRPYLAEGIPELGIPPCEPLLIPQIVINQGRGPVNIQSTYKRISVTGASQFAIKSIRVEPSKDRVRLKLWIPFLHMISDYELDGRILMLPVKGRGVSEGNYTDITANVVMEGERFDRKGTTYLNIKQFLVNFHIGHATIHMDDLFDGDEELGEAMNLFINENWDAIVHEVKPVLEDTISDMFKTFANSIFHKYPLDVIMPH